MSLVSPRSSVEEVKEQIVKADITDDDEEEENHNVDLEDDTFQDDEIEAEKKIDTE